MPDIIRIQSPKLAIELVKPGSPVYCRTRFDWTGFVSRITFDQKHEFAVPRQVIPERSTTSGIGLNNEFTNPGVVEATPEGETFPKFGVGILTKDKPGSWDFTHDYPCDPFLLTMEAGEDFVSYRLGAKSSQGMAAVQEKLVKVTDNTIEIETNFINVGDKEISVMEYNHNFVAINNRPVGPEYALYVKGFESIRDLPNIAPLRPGDGYFTWEGLPEGPFFAMIDQVVEPKPEYVWRLEHALEPVGLMESVDVPIHCMVLWGEKHVISNEVYVLVDVKPGQSMTWKRTWTFYYR